ncbi:MMPL family transporter [Nocardia mexicana]|uniref:RND superfamily putative drug exporter n=1 Tax=Nocardia mexicana TaxID=279262 RepID=A0A370GSW2_9NOCA|nr:MMPL family transporter [Nocardia mexicana]RDI46792.1 RND superfamily putative drug exporter [Nocardia mexicana]
MFTRWGDLVYRFRYIVLGLAVAGLLGLGAYGIGVENHLSSSGWDDPGSQSTQAARLKDEVYGRDHNSDVIVLYTAPEGKTIDDPAWGREITDSLNSLPKEHPEISKVNGAYWKTETGDVSPTLFGSKDKKYAFASIAIKGDNDTEMVNNFRKVRDAFDIPGVDVQVAGLQAVAGTLNDTISADTKRMELLAIPAVGVLLFFIFGGIVAAALPLIVGGLTVVGANGIVRALTNYTEVNSFVGAVVSMIGLGLAIDYGLFIVSRFREELAEGYTTGQAVRRSVMTAGRTVTFSAVMIIAASAGMLLFPQGFLKSIGYATIATVLLAALASITILPALLAILGKRVDALGLKWFRKTKTAEEIENGFWGRSTQWVMKHPLKIAIPIVIVLLLLIIPVKNLKFGGISETYLPPDNPTRVAQQNFDKIFPLRKTDPIQLAIVTDNPREIYGVLKQANSIEGFTADFPTPKVPPNGSNVWTSEATLNADADPNTVIDELRALEMPDDVELLVGGQPAMEKDSVDALLDRMPLMIALVLFVTTVLMFLTFGSLVLPIKAALMSALGLGSTLGILTWIFVDGHGASLLNFTPQPIMSPVLVLIIAIIYGLSTDYEVFLMSRMVEARSLGASTTEAVRIGTAQTGRIITAAALILLVVVGAFAFSDLVMMQYIAYGMMAALFIDATVLRMLLVPATMKLLGDDCWWAPKWMKKIQQKIGLGEPILDDERPGSDSVVDLVKTTPVTDPVTQQIPVMPDGTPSKPARKILKRPRFIGGVDGDAPTQQLGVIKTEPRPSGDTPGSSGDSGTETSGDAGQSGPQTFSSFPSANPDAPRLNLSTSEPKLDLGTSQPNPNLGTSSTLNLGTSQPNPSGSTGAATPVDNPGMFAPQTTPQTNLRLPRSIEPQSGVIGVTPSADVPQADPEPHGPSTPPAVSTPQSARPPLPPRTVPQHPTDSTQPTQPQEPARSQYPAQPDDPGRPLDSDRSEDATGSQEPGRPTGTTPRVLPPQPSAAKVAPHPATRAQQFHSHEAQGRESDSPAPYPTTAPEQQRSAAPEQRPFSEPERQGFAAPEQQRFGTPEQQSFAAPEHQAYPAQGSQAYPEPEHQAYSAQENQAYSAPEHQAYSAPEQPAEPDEPPAPQAEADPPDDSNRNSIERWMADLRSSRRKPEQPDPDDEGKHRGGAGRTVSVNELLRRQNRD